MPTTLRPARPEDHAWLSAWLPDAAATAHWAGAAARHPLRSYEWERLLDEGDGRSHVLQDGDEPVAFGQCTVAGPGNLRLCHLIVRPERRRQGWGLALCTRLIDLALAEPTVRALLADVHRQDIAARNLFSKFGFQGLAAAPGNPLLPLRCLLRRPPA